MNVIRSEKISPIEDNLVAEVEAGIRDFARGDLPDLRRPASLPSTTDKALDPSTEASVSNINSSIEHVAEPSLTQIGKLISELGSMREMLHVEGRRVHLRAAGLQADGVAAGAARLGDLLAGLHLRGLRRRRQQDERSGRAADQDHRHGRFLAKT